MKEDRNYNQAGIGDQVTSEMENKSMEIDVTSL